MQISSDWEATVLTDFSRSCGQRISLGRLIIEFIFQNDAYTKVSNKISCGPALEKSCQSCCQVCAHTGEEQPVENCCPLVGMPTWKYVNNTGAMHESWGLQVNCSGMDWLDKSTIYPRKILSRYLKVITLAEDPIWFPLPAGASAEAPEAARAEVKASSLSSTWGTLLSKRVPASS